MIITLANLHEATKQQVFDQVAKHLLTQNEQSSVDRKMCAVSLRSITTCRYRHGALKCAAGSLIADDEYKPEMDGASSNQFSGTSWISGIQNGLFPVTEHTQLITKLQSVHDDLVPVKWRDGLIEVANNHGLNSNVIPSI